MSVLEFISNYYDWWLFIGFWIGLAASLDEERFNKVGALIMGLLVWPLAIAVVIFK